MFTRMKKFTLQSIKLILNIIYVPFYIASRSCTGIINYLGIEYKEKDVYSKYLIIKNTGIFSFIDKWMSFLYDFWDAKQYRNPERWTMYKEIKEIFINLLPRLLSLPFIAALAITKGVLMLAVSVLHATNYLLEDLVMSAINKLITTIDSHIASYDKDDSSHLSHQGDKHNTWASKTLGLRVGDWPISVIYSQSNNSNLKTNNKSVLNESPDADMRSRADSDESTKSRESLSM